MSARVKSQSAPAIRKRLRRNAGNLEEDVALLQKVQMRKYKPIEEWDLKELAMGMPRQASGKFDGPKPKWITPLIQEEVQRRLRKETLVHFNQEAASAVKVLVDFLSNDEEPRLRFDAARLILEYVIGKPQQNITVEGNVTLQSMLASALVLPSGEDAHPVIDGQFTEEEDDDDEDL
jgi:hypothetical protein